MTGGEDALSSFTMTICIKNILISGRKEGIIKHDTICQDMCAILMTQLVSGGCKRWDGRGRDNAGEQVVQDRVLSSG